MGAECLVASGVWAQGQGAARGEEGWGLRTRVDSMCDHFILFRDLNSKMKSDFFF